MYTVREVMKMYNILVCDDDKAIVEAIEIYLSQEGYHILKSLRRRAGIEDIGDRRSTSACARCDDAASGRNQGNT